MSNITQCVCPFPHVEAFLINATPEFEEMAAEAIKMNIEHLLNGNSDAFTAVESAELLGHHAASCGIEESEKEAVCHEVMTWAHTGLVNINTLAIAGQISKLCSAVTDVGDMINRLFVRALDGHHIIVGVKDETNS